MKKDDFRNRHMLMGAGLIIFGLIVIVINGFINQKVINYVLETVATAIALSGIFSLADAYFLKEGLVDLILSKLELKKDIDKMGIEEVLPSINEIRYRHYFKKSIKNIDIVHIYAQTWTNTNIEEVADRFLKGNCRVRVVLVDPRSPFVNPLNEHFKYEDGELEKLINKVSQQWKEKYNKKLLQGKKKTQGTLELYYHCGFPASSLYRIDDRIIIVDNKLAQEKTKILPSIVVKNICNGESFYNIYLEQIEQLIKESKLVNFEEM